MKRFLLIILAAFAAISAGNNPRLTYIEKYAALAQSEMQRTGVPASITLAQGLIESGAGESPLAVKGNNHFGIKCHNDWDGDTMTSDDDQEGECFRVYPTVESSFRDHSDFLRSKDRYKSLFDLEPTDYKGWAKGLKKAGYATDSGYATKLIDLIEDYQLYKYDAGTPVEVSAPLALETPTVISAKTETDRKYKEYVTISLSREVYKQNGVPFVYSAEGETYESIATSFSLFKKELLGFNDLYPDRALAPGTIVYLAKKKTEAAPGVSKYVVDHDGETLYEISQRFAIRYAVLQRLNILLLGKDLTEGDTVRLRKD